jgi:hypothetical protein
LIIIFFQQQEAESTSKDQPKQAWCQPPLQDYEQQQRGSASEGSRKVWMDRDPYNRQQPDEIRLQQQGAGVHLTHEQRFELSQRNAADNASKFIAPTASHQSSNPWNRSHQTQQQQQQQQQQREGNGYTVASFPEEDAFLGAGEGIAVGDDYSRAQQGPSAPHMLFNHRTGCFEPPPKEHGTRSHIQQQPRGWVNSMKPKSATAETPSVAPAPPRSILKAPVVSSSRALPDPKSLRDEARYPTSHAATVTFQFHNFVHQFRT